MKAVVLAVAVIAALTVTAGTAQAGSWRAGTPYMIEESDANDILEQVVDHAYCTGVPRFGRKGEFPYEKYVVFDCTIDHGDLYCTDVRYRAVKAKKRGYYRLSGNIKASDCF